MNSEIALIRRRLDMASTAPRRKEIVEIARYLEYVSLEFNILPDEFFSVYIDVLSSPVFCAVSGVEEFVAAIFTDFEKLSEEQQYLLTKLFMTHGYHFFHPMLRISVSDLIARKYCDEVALDIFFDMWTSGKEFLQDMAYSGAQVLSRLFPKTGESRNRLRKLGELMKADRKGLYPNR